MDNVKQFTDNIKQFIIRIIKEEPHINIFTVKQYVINQINQMKLNDNIYEDIINKLLEYVNENILIKDINENFINNDDTFRVNNIQDIINYLKRKNNIKVLSDPLLILLSANKLVSPDKTYELVDKVIYENLFFFCRMDLMINLIKNNNGTC